MRNIYINSDLNQLTKFSSSNRSTEFKDILPWNISQMITKTIPISTRMVISQAMKQGILFWDYWKVNGNRDRMIRINQWRENHWTKNTSVRRKKEIQERRTVRITVRDLSRKVNYMREVVWDITEFPGSISSTRISLWWTLKSPKTNTVANGLIERTSSMLDEIEAETVHNDE